MKSKSRRGLTFFRISSNISTPNASRLLSLVLFVCHTFNTYIYLAPGSKKNTTNNFSLSSQLLPGWAEDGGESETFHRETGYGPDHSKGPRFTFLFNIFTVFPTKVLGQDFARNVHSVLSVNSSFCLCSKLYRFMDC